MDFINWLAIYGAILSSILGFFELRSHLYQRGKIKITAALTIPKNKSKSDECKLALRVLKKGKDPVFMESLVYGSKGKIAGVTSLENSPIKLIDEGETHFFSNIDPVLLGIDYLGIYDTRGRYYAINKKVVKKLKEVYEKIKSENN